MPVLVFVCGLALGTERWSPRTGAVLLLVVAGVLTASHGELVWVGVGVAEQAASLVAEALRLTLVQLLLQRRGVRLDPMAAMHHVSPVCLAALLVPFALLEARAVAGHSWAVGVSPGLLLGSAVAACGLNLSVFLLIGRTSALTMNVGGVVKDVLLIALSVALFGWARPRRRRPANNLGRARARAVLTPPPLPPPPPARRSAVTTLQVAGYGVALCAVVSYNLGRLRRQQSQQQQLQSQQREAAPTVSATIRLTADGSCGGKGGKQQEQQQHAEHQAGDAEQPLLLRACHHRQSAAGQPHDADSGQAARLVLHVKR